MTDRLGRGTGPARRHSTARRWPRGGPRRAWGERVCGRLFSARGVEAPPSMVDRMLHGLLHAYEVPHEKAEAFYQESRPIAVAQVRRELVLSTLAEREGLKATEADLDARIAKIAEQ